ncbi:ESX-1 secretion-associated protein [Mycolicibacterium peregrinum]|uniref:ESX-1 secretion-associated protein n=1 Tax=Mycolicibacterium peregrinum TaxID=43304 RepID=UPI0009ECF962|nr:ESX-1 secretion-associated protein [Mycolicibacterium peregrinum]
MSGELRVDTSHVRDLAERQSTAAKQVLEAGTTTNGVGMSMLANHGVVCAPANTAVTAAEQARAFACASMNAVSSSLSQKLGVAASRYDGTDAQSAGQLGKQMHPR